MAVIAFRSDAALRKLGPVIAKLEALPIKDAFEKPLSYAFDPRVVRAEWRNTIVEHYG